MKKTKLNKVALTVCLCILLHQFLSHFSPVCTVWVGGWNREDDDGTYNCAVIAAQKTQVGLAVQVDRWETVKGENLEGESGRRGIAILDHLYCIICWIRTPEKQARRENWQLAG